MNSSVTLHHTHLVTADIAGTCEYYGKNFGAEVVFDGDIAGDRNVFLRIGTGRIHLFETKEPPVRSRNLFHHLGMMVEDLDETVERLACNGVKVSGITRTPGGGFAMATGPDNVLIELFEVTAPEARAWFIASDAGNSK